MNKLDRDYIYFVNYVELFIQALYHGDIFCWEDHFDLWFSDKGSLKIITKEQFEFNLLNNKDFFEDWGKNE